MIRFVWTIVERIRPWALSDEHALGTAHAIVSWATGLSRACIAIERRSLTDAELNNIEQAISDLLYAHKPLAYIVGTQPFLDMDLVVRPPILIPRLETEGWCAELIAELRSWPSAPKKILDLCTGSGCLALALARAFPSAQVIGVDIDPVALEVALENALRYGVQNVSWYQSDLYEALPEGGFDVIVANPPYISAQDYNNLDLSVRLWEAPHALWAENRGLAVIARIIEKSPIWLSQSSRAEVWIEVDCEHIEAVIELFATAGFYATKMQDIYGRHRIVIGRRT